MSDFGHSESDATCPVSLDRLGELYRANTSLVPEMVAKLPDCVRAKLAFFCYGRAHLRPLALILAATCDEDRLAAVAGTLGEVLAAQCRSKALKSGRRNRERVATPAKPKITLRVHDLELRS